MSRIYYPKGKEPLGWLLLILVIYLLAFASTLEAQTPSWVESPKAQSSAVVKVARTQLGVRERSGNNDGFEVERYLATTGLSGGFAWCAAFVNWCMIYAGADHPTSKAAWSPSWFPAERTYWQVYKAEYKAPQPGDVFGIYFPQKGRIAHVGIIEDWHGSYATTIEGNTNRAGSREGDGVYRKKRLKRQVSKTSKWTR